MKPFYLLLIFAAVVTSSKGQGPANKDADSEIKKLSFLTGEWRGSGWFQSDQQKDSLKIHGTNSIDGDMNFKMDLSSEVLSTGTKINTTILVSYNAKNKKFVTSATSFGRTSEGTAVLADDHTLQCRYILGNGTEFKYTYTVSGNTQTIAGETTSDSGASWTQIFDGSLSK